MRPLGCVDLDLDDLPSAVALANAASLLRAAEAMGLPCTGIGPCVDGGIGLAWSDERVAADVEVYNDGTITFSYRKRGTQAEFVSIEATHAAIQRALERVRELHRSL